MSVCVSVSRNRFFRMIGCLSGLFHICLFVRGSVCLYSYVWLYVYICPAIVYLKVIFCKGKFCLDKLLLVGI